MGAFCPARETARSRGCLSLHKLDPEVCQTDQSEIIKEPVYMFIIKRQKCYQADSVATIILSKIWFFLLCKIKKMTERDLLVITSLPGPHMVQAGTQSFSSVVILPSILQRLKSGGLLYPLPTMISTMVQTLSSINDAISSRAHR